MTRKKFLTSVVMCICFGISQNGMAQNDYFVTTEGAVVNDSVSIETAGLSAEQNFLNKNFPYRSLCDWKEGMRFMVIPSDKDNYIKAFVDLNSGNEIAAGTLKHKIVVYKGHEITERGWIRLHFEVSDTKQRIFHEVRNLTFDEYCQKQAGGGVPSLAYLDEVDVAKGVLMGKELYTAHEIFYKDDSSTRNGYREAAINIDTKVTVTAVGVGNREYPVKIVVTDSKGNKFFQLCALSHTNSGMNDNDFIAKNEQHLFDKSFRFKAKYTNEKARQKDDPTKNFSALPRTGPTSPSNTRYINYAGLVSGLIEKGHTKDMTKMSKGEPDKKWTNKDGSVVWWYADGTEITFSKKGIATKVKVTSNPSK
ncbi:MAG: hypothetical protein MJZ60_09390 [Bacteroidaceae bacterium]|nr:hypothetical protein [Bacteroidaceae bacterium]